MEEDKTMDLLDENQKAKISWIGQCRWCKTAEITSGLTDKVNNPTASCKKEKR